MTKFNDYLAKQLENPAFKKEFNELEPEFAIIKAIAEARQNAGLTQEELSARTGIAQSDISKLENGNANPSLETLKRFADGMDMTLKVEFLARAQ